MGLRPIQGNANRRVFDRAAMGPQSRRILGLSLAFQAQSVAVGQLADNRFGAANASERPWRTTKPVAPKG